MKSENPIPNYDHIREVSDLEPGMLIGIALPHTVGDFVRHIAEVISGVYNPEVAIVNTGLLTNQSIQEIINQGKYREKFFGKLGESNALVLPTNTSRMPKSTLKHIDLEHPRAVNFLVATRMDTTGRAESIGNVVNEILLCGDRLAVTQFYVKVRPAGVSQTLKEVEACIETSAGRYAEALREGLKHIYPAGLPSHGRKR